MIGIEIDVKNTELRINESLSGHSLIKAVREFPRAIPNALASTAASYGFTGAAQAISTGRIDDLAAAVGQDAINQVANNIQSAVNRAVGEAAGIINNLLKSIGVGATPAGEVMLILGGFAFMISTAAYQTIKRTVDYRWAQQDRLFRRPAKQWIGVGNENIDLDGYLLPGFTGGVEAIEALRDIAALGQPLELIDHFGMIYGRFTVNNIEDTGSFIDIYGQSRRIDFKISMSAYGEDNQDDELGEATNQIAENVNIQLPKLNIQASINAQNI